MKPADRPRRMGAARARQLLPGAVIVSPAGHRAKITRVLADPASANGEDVAVFEYQPEGRGLRTATIASIARWRLA